MTIGVLRISLELMLWVFEPQRTFFLDHISIYNGTNYHEKDLKQFQGVCQLTSIVKLHFNDENSLDKNDNSGENSFENHLSPDRLRIISSESMHFCQLYDISEKYHTIYHKHHKYCAKVRKFKFETRGIKSNLSGDYHFIKHVSLRFDEK
jgi:hypothetical protein